MVVVIVMVVIVMVAMIAAAAVGVAHAMDHVVGGAARDIANIADLMTNAVHGAADDGLGPLHDGVAGVRQNGRRRRLGGPPP